MKFFNILKSILSSLLTTIGLKKSTKNLKPISNFNLAWFIGTWYEIARYDHWFESGQTNVYTTYKLNEDFSISVTNTRIYS
jgi:apolipoprotein D and lipocalin family protein